MSEEVSDSPKSFCESGDHEGESAITGMGCPGFHAPYNKKHILSFKDSDFTESISEDVTVSTNEKR